MTDIFRARRGRGALSESEDDDYSDSDTSLTSHEDGYSTGEDTSDYGTESDEYEETETDEEYEQEAAVVEQETSHREEEEDSQPKTPEQFVHSTLPLVVENSSSPHSMEESNQQESIKYEPQINSDNNKTSPIVVEKTEEMIPQEQEQVTYQEAPTKEEEQYTQQQHVVEQHNEHQEECQKTVTTDANEQPNESMAEIDSEISKDPQEKRIQEHREYRRKLAEDPSFVPYIGLFWSHDDRYREDSLTETRQSPAFPVKPSQNNNAPHDRRADPLMNKRWDHGGYEELVRMEQENDERKHDHPEQDLKQHDTQPNRQHFNRSRPPQERHHKFNNNNNTRNNAHQPREEWPVVSSGDAHTKDEKTDVANASWATVTVDDLEEHGKPANRRPSWNNRKASYKNGDRRTFRRDSHYKTQHNTFDKIGQSSFRENRYKQPETRNNSDHNENQKRDNESTRPTRQLSKNLGGWGDAVSDGETSRSVDNNNSTPTPEWNTQSEKPGWSDKAVSDPPSTTGWNDVPAATTTNETVDGGGRNAVPEAEKANATWGDLSSIKESTGNDWSNSPKTDDNSSINQWSGASPKTSNVGWNKGVDTNNNHQLKQNHASPIQNNMGNGWNHADRAHNNSKDDNWKSKEHVDIKPRSGWNSPQKEPSHHRKQSPAMSKSVDPNIVNEMAAAQWSQPVVTVNIDLSTAIGNGWGEGATIIKAENSEGLAKPVTTIDPLTPATSDNAQVVNGWSQDLTSTEKPTSGWGDSSASSSLPPPAKTPTTDNTSIEKVSDWSSAALNDKKASGWDSSVEQTTDKEKSTVADEEKAIGWGSLVEPAVSKEKSQEWGTSLSTVKNQNTLELSKPETAENKETLVAWDDSTAVTSTEKSPNQESVGWSEDVKNTIEWSEAHDTTVEEETKEVDLTKTKEDSKTNSQEETGRKENASTRSTLNASANGWTGSDKISNSPSWTPNMNWGARNELSGRKGYLSQKTEAPIIKAETIELPIDTRINPILHDSYEDDSDVEIILEDDDAERFNNEPVLGISAPERPTVIVDEPWEKKAPTRHFMSTEEYTQQPPSMPMYYASQIQPNGAMTYIPIINNGPNSSPMFAPYPMGMPTSPAMGTSSPNSPHKYYSPIPGPSILHPPPGYEANGMVYYGVGPSTMYPPQQYYYMSGPTVDPMEQDDGEGWGPPPEAPEKEEEWSKDPYSQHPDMNYPQSYYYYY